MSFTHPCLDEVQGLNLRRRWSLFRRCGRLGQPRLMRIRRGWELDLWPLLVVWRERSQWHLALDHKCFLPHRHFVGQPMSSPSETDSAEDG